jgi:hypothetical protein
MYCTLLQNPALPVHCATSLHRFAQPDRCRDPSDWLSPCLPRLVVVTMCAMFGRPSLIRLVFVSCDESSRELSEEILPTCERGLGEMSCESRVQLLISLESIK